MGEMVAVVDEQDTSTTIGDSLVRELEPPEAEPEVVTGDEVKVDAVKTDEAKPEPKAEPVVDGDAELRALLRSQSRELALLKAQVSRHDAVQKGDVGAEPPPLAEIEKVQQEIADISAKRGDFFDELLETMEINPKFEDVRSVCSQANVDYIVDSAAASLHKQNGGDRTLIALQLEHEIWSQKNPYKYIYNLVKTYHPNFKQAEGEVKTEKVSTAEVLAGVKTKDIKPTVGAIVGMGGSDADTKGSGWTSAKIDNLSETELGQVPADTYEKYLMGQLP